MANYQTRTNNGFNRSRHTIIDVQKGNASSQSTVNLLTTDTEVESLYDDVGGVSTPYFRLQKFDNNGNFKSASLVDANGSPYVPVNPISQAPKSDVEVLTMCFRDQADSSVVYTRVQFFDTESQAVNAEIWNDSAGAIIAQPANFISCAAPIERNALHYTKTDGWTIAPGARSVSFLNKSTAPATVQGEQIGRLSNADSISFSVDEGESLGEIVITGAGFNLTVVEVR